MIPISLKKNINLDQNKLSALNSQQYIKLNEYKKLLIRILNIKKIDVSSCSFDVENNKILLSIDLFFQTKKLVNYKFKTKKTKQSTNKKLPGRLIKQLNKKINLCYLRLKNINLDLNKKQIQFVYSNLKRFASMLFPRRYNLFVDFIKASSLFIEGKVSSELFLKYLGIIFSRLPKNKHSRFILFVKLLFEKIMFVEQTKIKGLKLIVNGKLQGKSRSGNSKIIVGNIPIQTINEKITKNQIHVYTLYGAFGFTMWTNKKS